MPSAAYISHRVVFPDAVRPAAILVDTDSGRILRIAERDSPGPVDHTHDCGAHAILPGLIDTHVHINEPGRTDWEGFATATRAAAAGGITTVVDMPLNCLPPTTTVAALEAKRAAAAGQCAVDWRTWGGCENGNGADLESLAAAGVPGFKCFLVDPGCDGLKLLDEPNLRAAAPILARLGLPLLVHAEDPEPIAAVAPYLAGRDWSHYATWLASRPDEAELAAIRLLIGVCREFGTRIHIVHLATALALPLIRDAKAEGLPLTVETCPHYLLFAAEGIGDGRTEFKCAPPIRDEANRDHLRAAVIDGTVDLVASDHSPCPPTMKEGDFSTAWGGIASLSLGASIFWTGLLGRGVALTLLAARMSSASAALAGLSQRKGRIEAGFDADLTIFSPEETFTVTPEDLHFRHPVSPYLGETLTGRVLQTILRGNLIFDHGAFPGEPTGREVEA